MLKNLQPHGLEEESNKNFLIEVDGSNTYTQHFAPRNPANLIAGTMKQSVHVTGERLKNRLVVSVGYYKKIRV